jgi:predicted amidohydrolase
MTFSLMAKYTSENGDFLVATLQTKTLDTYEKNLQFLLEYVKESKASLILTPELCLTNFDYENFEEAAVFYERAIAELLAVIDAQVLVLTMTVKEGKDFFNRAVVIHKQKVIHQQDKYKLFRLGNEEKYFKAGSKEGIIAFEIDDVKYAILICFELRFKELWIRLQGVDIVLVPARWGKSRKVHLETLSRALAIMNQCFVVLSNSADEEMASSSAIISPWGEVYADDSLEIIEEKIELKDVKRVRRLINIS